MYFERKGAKTQSVFLTTESTKETEYFWQQAAFN
jgi:hypothetical protein